MPSLPRIRRSIRSRPGADVVARVPQVSRAHRGRADLGQRGRARPRDRPGARRPLRLAPAGRRGHRLEAPAAEGRRLRGRPLPLRRPALPRLRQDRPAAERRRARRLHRPGLPRHDPEPGAAPGHAALRPLRRRRGVPRAALRQGVRSPALRGARRPVRLLLPDPRQDRPQARPDRGRHVRGRAPRTSSATSRTSSRRSSPTAR